MGWIKTTHRNQVSFKDSEMDNPIEWGDSRKANVSADLEEHLTNTYYSITAVDSDDNGDDGDGSDDGDGDEVEETEETE